MKLLISKEILSISILSMFLVFLVAVPIERLISPGIDASYIFAFNYFFSNNIQIGKDILFSFGPLGFLLWPQSQGNNLLIAMIIVYLTKYIFIFMSLYIFNIVQNVMTIKKWIVITILTYIIASTISTHDLFIFLTLQFLILYYIKKNLFFLIASSIVVGIALLIKSSMGIISLLYLLSFSVYFLWKKNYTIIFYSLLGTTITFILIWALLYENMSGIGTYLYATLELSRGNSTAMTINPNNNWWLFSGFVLLFLSFPLLKKEKIALFLFLVSLLPIAAAFKYAVAREDHIFYFSNFLIQFIFIIFIITKKFTFKEFLHLSVMYLLFILFIFKTPYKNNIKNHFEHYVSALKVNTADFINYKNNTSQLNMKSKILLHPFILDKADKVLIGDKSVDTYPLDTAYIAANNLNWTPRPIFQSYISYTPYLDKKNADFFNSPLAPEFIIWHRKHWGGEVLSLDNRYLLNDEPFTIKAILSNYKVIVKRDSYLILKRSINRLSSKVIATKSYRWNQWIEVPQVQSNKGSSILIAKTNIPRSIIQKIKKLLYKEFEVYISYKFNNGEEEHYRVVVDTAKDGLWISPLLNTLFKSPPLKNITSIKFMHHKFDYFEEKFTIEWNILTTEKPIFE